jgi:DNA-binding NarL/FixJ family response regulator
MGVAHIAGNGHDHSAITILLVAEHLVLREGLRRLLEQEPGFIVVGDVSDPEEASEVAQAVKPIILLVGFSGRPLIRTIRSLQQLVPNGIHGRTLVLTTKMDRSHMLQAQQLGVAGILLKDTSSRALVNTLRSVAAGECAGTPAELASLVASTAPQSIMPDGPAAKIAFGLTSRELEIVAAVRRGDSNRAIARRFSLSEDTVKHHLTRVFDKTGVFSRLELAMFAIKHGLGEDAAVGVNR